LISATIPSVRTVGRWAFGDCTRLADLDLPEGLETIEGGTFEGCYSLGRISMPLKDDMIGVDVFYGCPRKLTMVTLVGGIHKIIASLHLESWRNEMIDF